MRLWILGLVCLTACDPAAVAPADVGAPPDVGAPAADGAIPPALLDGPAPPPVEPDVDAPSLDPDLDAAPPPDASPPAAHFCEQIAPTPLRRLTARQYRNTVTALIGDDAIGVELADPVGPFIPLLEVERYAAAAQAIAEQADLEALTPCDPALDGEAVCAAEFIAEFGALAFRRALDDEEVEWLTGVFDGAPAELDFAARQRIVIQVVLQAPQLLYHVPRVGPPGPGAWRWLTGEALAARLSYALGDAPPDKWLRARAATLVDPEALAAAATHLLADPARGRAKLLRFFHEWIGLAGLTDVVKRAPGFPRAAIRREAEAFIERAVFTEGTLGALLTDRRAFVEPAIAAIYGVPAPAEPGWVELDPEQRAGILTRAAFLSLAAGPEAKSAIRRGAFIRRRLLCSPTPPPPPMINDAPIVRGSVDDDGAPRSLRELTERRTAGPDCAGCHALINPSGYPLQNYDAWGRFESIERGVDGDGVAYEVEVDARGALPGTDVAGAIDGPIELSIALAESAQVSDCLVTQWYEFFFDRPIVPADACSVAALQRAFRESGGDFEALVRATVQLDAFRAAPVDP